MTQLCSVTHRRHCLKAFNVLLVFRQILAFNKNMQCQKTLAWKYAPVPRKVLGPVPTATWSRRLWIISWHRSLAFVVNSVVLLILFGQKNMFIKTWSNSCRLMWTTRSLRNTNQLEFPEHIQNNADYSKLHSLRNILLGLRMINDFFDG